MLVIKYQIVQNFVIFFRYHIWETYEYITDYDGSKYSMLIN